MQPKRAGKPLRIQEPSRRQPSRLSERTLYNTEDFWIDYGATRGEEERLDARQLHDFWIEYEATRTTEERFDAWQIERWIDYTKQHPPRQQISLRVKRAADRARRYTAVNRRAHKIRARVGKTTTPSLGGSVAEAVKAAYRNNWRFLSSCKNHWKTISATSLALILYLNYRKASLIANQVPKPLEKYRQFPTWMYTDPIQVLGLPTAVSPELVPNIYAIDKARKTFGGLWHTDKWKLNGFRDKKAAVLAHNRGIEAHNILLRWYENPYCDRDAQAFELRHQPEFAYNDSLPSFAHPCRCTYPIYIVESLKRIFLPYSWQPKVPQTDLGLRSFCPCNKSQAKASWSTFSMHARPPLLSRISDTLPRISLDYRVMWYKICTRRAPRYLSLNWWDVTSCIAARMPECKDLAGWVVEGDFFGGQCLSDVRKAEIASISQRSYEFRWEQNQNGKGN